MMRRRVYLPSAGVRQPRADFDWEGHRMRVLLVRGHDAPKPRVRGRAGTLDGWLSCCRCVVGGEAGRGAFSACGGGARVHRCAGGRHHPPTHPPTTGPAVGHSPLGTSPQCRRLSRSGWWQLSPSRPSPQAFGIGGAYAHCLVTEYRPPELPPPSSRTGKQQQPGS